MRIERKEKRQKGLKYDTKTGKPIEARVPKNYNECKCKHKCTVSFTPEDQVHINREYWDLGDYSKQALFLRTCIKVLKCKRALTVSSRRAQTFVYEFRGVQVCKKFFKSTLNISDGFITTWAKKQSENRFDDKRGKHNNQRKINEDILALIKDHIESFPAVESHYTRAKSQRKYLSCILNIKRMARLFKEKYPDTKISNSLYRRIFNTHYNLSFHRPKKDACSTCEKYKNAKDKAPLQEAYDAHMANKIMARESKERDKEEAKVNPGLKVFTFDLQSVLATPCSRVSDMYYVRKFATYNSTFYDLATGDGFCFLWNETTGKRGSNEIGTTMFKMLTTLNDQVCDVILYSDCCGGQNRNRFIAALLMYMNATLNLKSITMKFLESGHTQMEADSMHSAIESRKKKACVYSPEEWPTILRLARVDNPYKVIAMQNTEILDLQELFGQLGNSLKKNDDGKKVNWLKIKMLQVQRADPQSLYYKEHWDGPLLKIDLANGKRRTTKRCLKITKKFNGPLPIAMAKLHDLQKLCKNNVIPVEYHDFYMKLEGAEKRDCLDEPDLNEEDPEPECESTE